MPEENLSPSTREFPGSCKIVFRIVALIKFRKNKPEHQGSDCDMAAAKLIQLPTLGPIRVQIKLCCTNNNNGRYTTEQNNNNYVGRGYYSHKPDKHESRAETI